METRTHFTRPECAQHGNRDHAAGVTIAHLRMGKMTCGVGSGEEMTHFVMETSAYAEMGREKGAGMMNREVAVACRV